MCALDSSSPTARRLDPTKFRHRETTADGSPRASVRLARLETLWINTGSLCNIECRSCYIESSPHNDRLAYLGAAEVAGYLDEVVELDLGTREIGFTGGEPFLNPELLAMLDDALGRGFEALVLTNAMRPMMRPKIRHGLLAQRREHGDRLHLRVSLDHYTHQLHDKERGRGGWQSTLEGLRWLIANGFRLSVAGRTCWGETGDATRAGYAELFAAEGLALDVSDPRQLVLFPEMDAALDVPEITVDCWQAVGVDPASLMCATSRMVVRRRAAAAPAVVACTLVPYDRRFELGGTLAEALGTVWLAHPHCARFCVLGGGSCS